MPLQLFNLNTGADNMATGINKLGQGIQDTSGIIEQHQQNAKAMDALAKSHPELVPGYDPNSMNTFQKSQAFAGLTKATQLGTQVMQQQELQAQMNFQKARTSLLQNMMGGGNGTQQAQSNVPDTNSLSGPMKQAYVGNAVQNVQNVNDYKAAKQMGLTDDRLQDYQTTYKNSMAQLRKFQEESAEKMRNKPPVSQFDQFMASPSGKNLGAFFEGLNPGRDLPGIFKANSDPGLLDSTPKPDAATLEALKNLNTLNSNPAIGLIKSGFDPKNIPDTTNPKQPRSTRVNSSGNISESFQGMPFTVQNALLSNQ